MHFVQGAMSFETLSGKNTTGHVHSLVPLAMVDHKLAQQIGWREGIVICFSVIAWQSCFRCSNHDFGDTLPSVCASLTKVLLRRWYTAFAHVIPSSLLMPITVGSGMWKTCQRTNFDAVINIWVRYGHQDKLSQNLNVCLTYIYFTR